MPAKKSAAAGSVQPQLFTLLASGCLSVAKMAVVLCGQLEYASVGLILCQATDRRDLEQKMMTVHIPHISR